MQGTVHIAYSSVSVLQITAMRENLHGRSALGAPLVQFGDGKRHHQLNDQIQATEPLIFISHAETDRQTAYAVAKEFDRHGLPCWIASRDIPVGEDAFSEIEAALERSTHLILLYSCSSSRSRHVRNEIELWQELHKPILPIQLDNSKLSGGMRYHLARLQWAKTPCASRITEIFRARFSI